MKSKAILVLAILLVSSMAAFAQEGGEARGQGRGQGRGAGRGEQQETVVATDKVTPGIPGVVKAGTKIEVVKNGLRGSDGGVGMPDGSLLVTANGGLAKVDVDGNVTTLLDKSEQAAGLAMDSKGRIFAAQYSKKVSLIYPKDGAETLTDSFDGKPYIRPNDLVVDKKGGIYFTDCYQVGANGKRDRPACGRPLGPAARCWCVRWVR